MGSELLRWWDGARWTAQTLWPWSPPAPAPTRLAVWLDSAAGAKLLAATAAVTALGWAAAGAFFAVTAVTGRPVSAAVPVLDDAFFPALLILDFAAAIWSLAAGARRRAPAPQAKATRAMRRAARRAQVRARRRPPVLAAVRAVTRRVFSRLSPPLPRRIRWISASVTAFTLLALVWLAAWSIPHDSLSFARPLWSTVPGQQLTAVAWMTHLLAWCTLACKRLANMRAATRLWAEPPSNPQS